MFRKSKLKFLAALTTVSIASALTSIPAHATLGGILRLGTIFTGPGSGGFKLVFQRTTGGGGTLTSGYRNSGAGTSGTGIRYIPTGGPGQTPAAVLLSMRGGPVGGTVILTGNSTSHGNIHFRPYLGGN